MIHKQHYNIENFMQDFIEIAPDEFSGKIFNMIANEHMLITSGNENSFNTMTASLGMFGMESWKYAASCFVRRATYTFEFLEKNDLYSLSFFGGDYQEQIDNIIGRKSGRDGDKVKEAGLTPVFFDGTTTFAEAKVIMICRKMYVRDIEPKYFVQEDMIPSMYKNGTVHRVYTGEIIKMYVRIG